VTEIQMRELIGAALVATRDLDDSREAESYYAAVLDALLSAPDLRGPVARMFIREIGAARSFAADLIAYCMHTLRWPEVREAVIRLVEPQDSEGWRRKALDYRDVLQAYDDNWRGRCLYERYSRG
jgi:hypothetical protein